MQNIFILLIYIYKSGLPNFVLSISLINNKSLYSDFIPVSSSTSLIAAKCIGSLSLAAPPGIPQVPYLNPIFSYTYNTSYFSFITTLIII